MATRGAITVREAGRRGGAKGGEVTRTRYGHPFYEAIGRKGGEARARELGHAGYEELGRKGGRTTARRYGHEFYEAIGHKGGQRVRELIEEGKRAQRR